MFVATMAACVEEQLRIADDGCDVDCMSGASGVASEFNFRPICASACTTTSICKATYVYVYIIM